MPTSRQKLVAELTADDQMSKVFKGVEQAGEKMRKKFQSISQDAEQFRNAFAVIGGAGVVAIKSFVDSANEAERGVAQLNAVLASTGGVAGVTSQMALDLAGSLQKMTTVGDEAILGAENMLLTFTSIGKDIFPQTTQTVLDMAVAMNNGLTPSAEQLSSQALQLGKALNNPTEGLSALTRAGVKFTEEQKKQITTMEKHGNVAGAQKVILAELAKEFGGSAQAAAKTFSGQIENLQNRMGELGESIGKAMIPILQQLGDKINELVSWFEGLTPQQQEFIAQTILIGTAVAGAAVAIATLIAAFNPINIAILAVVAGFLYLSSELNKAGMSWEEFGVAIKVTWDEAVYWVTSAIDHIIIELRKLTLATDKEINDMADSMNKDLDQKWSKVKGGYDKLNQLHTEGLDKQKAILEDSIANQRDLVDKSSGAERDAAKKKLEQMKNDAIAKYKDIKLGSTAELADMRKQQAAQFDKMNEQTRAKLQESVNAALSWGAHLMQNLSTGIWGKMPVLGAAINKAKELMNSIHQSYNPELPAKLWGEHFLENFAAGMKESAPKVFENTEDMKKALQAEFGSDGDITKLLSEWSKDKNLSENFAQIAEKVRAEAEKIGQSFEAQKKDYDDLNLKAGESLAQLKQKHEDELNQINLKIDETKKQIKDLNENYKIDIQGVDSSVGEQVVRQQDLVAQLQKQISDAANSGKQQDTSDLEAKYEKERQALEAFMSTSKGLEDEIAEARRRTNLTDFERFIEDSTARKKTIEEEFTKKLELLELEKVSLEDQRAKEKEIFDKKVVQYTELMSAFNLMQTNFTTGLSTMASTAQEKVTFINKKLEQLKAAMNEISSLSGPNPLVGGSGGGGIKKFAGGGVIDQPTLALMGEAGTEAVVPLPDGSNIPVKISGQTSGSGKTEVNIYFGGVAISKEVDAQNFFKQVEDRFTRMIQLQKMGSSLT